MALLFYAITLFVSAFLLFLVQPIIGQKILPKLGGTPSVWNTCVVFFQCALLVGYAYTHFTSKLPVKRQILIHCLLLFVPFLILLPGGTPFNVENFRPDTGANPMMATLLLLAMIVGIPFFVVSTTAPLLQKWFGSTGHPAAKDPYFLYGASNFGSMLSLLLYPAVFEPVFGLDAQSWFYTIGYAVLVVLVLGCAAMAFLAAPTVQLPGGKKETAVETVPSLAPDPPPEPAPSAAQSTAPPSTAVTSTPPPPVPAPALTAKTAATGIKKGGKKGKGRDLAKMAPAGAIAPAATAAAIAATTSSIAKPATRFDPDEITWARRFRWIGLAAVPSSLMLGVTIYMSTDISAIPLFWVLPLALYLFSFILVFMRWPINWLEQAHDYVLYAQPAMLALLVLFMSVSGLVGVVYMIFAMLFAFTLTALACHGEMARDRPSAKHLTEFYLLMSVGGAVGGLFNAIVAPVIFPWGIVEFGLALTVAALLRPVMMETGWIEWIMGRFSGSPDAGPRHAKGGKRIARSSDDGAGLTLILDIGVPVALAILLAVLLFGLVAPSPRSNDYAQGMFMCVIVPLAMAASFYERPLRFGLTLGAVLLLTSIYANRGGSIFQTRSYFGVLRVQESAEHYGDFYIPYRTLMHGTTNHGMALQADVDTPPRFPDFTRLATTYYHRQGPVGICMDRFCWFDKEGDNNSFLSDVRMQLSLMQMGAPVPGITLPGPVLAGIWSSPSYAVIGMGTATMSSYCRPYQICHFFEIDEQIKRLSLPLEGNRRFFGYVQAALDRKANVQILMGDARLRMALPWIPDHPNDKVDEAKKKFKEAGLPGAALELRAGETTDPTKIEFKDRGGAEYFYHLMVVDAFSSDAIPRHLITKQGMEMYFKHLVQGRWGPWIDVDPSNELKDIEGNHIESLQAKFWWERKTEVTPEGRSKVLKRAWYPGGVLCVHTSNRHLQLVPVVTDSASVVEWYDLYDRDETGLPKKKTGLVAKKGHDIAPGHQYLNERNDIGHFTSEWVMVARDEKDLKHLVRPGNYNAWVRAAHDKFPRKVPESEEYWSTMEPTSRQTYVWTDDHSNLMAVFRWSHD